MGFDLYPFSLTWGETSSVPGVCFWAVQDPCCSPRLCGQCAVLFLLPWILSGRALWWRYCGRGQGLWDSTLNSKIWGPGAFFEEFDPLVLSPGVRLTVDQAWSTCEKKCLWVVFERTTWATSSTIEAAEWRMFDLWWIPVPVKPLESRRLQSKWTLEFKWW